MVLFENAKVIEPYELKELMDEQLSNPTISRMMFIEQKSKYDDSSKVFPCYLESYGMEENSEMKVDPGLRFRMCIIQSDGKEFGMIRVEIMANKFGQSTRIWDKPPTKGLRESTPWAAVEEGVQ